MKQAALFLLLAVNLSGACKNSQDNGQTTTHYFRTKLDHFDDADNAATFEFRYMSNGEHYKPGRPIFVYVGGPWPMYSYYIENGHFYDIAVRERGWLFANEHRFYGDSIPNGDLSTDNLKFLTVEQALEDLAELIRHLKGKVVCDENVKVILMGAGYGGTVATYMRKQYPELVDGVWISSGRVEARLNFKEYAVLIGEMILKYGDQICYERIKTAYREAEIELAAGFNRNISEMFKTCETIQTSLDEQTFFYSVTQKIQFEILAQQTVESTKLICDSLNNSKELTNLQRLAEWVRNNTQDQDCNPYDFETSLTNLRDVDIGNDENKLWGKRQLAYQSCTEFGWFLTTDALDQPFGHRVDMEYFYNYCAAIFGGWLTPEVINDGIRRTNERFGGQNQDITNVLFVNGGLDPMRNISITEYHEKESDAIVISEYFSSADMGSISDQDSPELMKAKLRIEEFVQRWIN
uniref:Serine protease K12H4.7 n=1 Tax=Culex pipiens TaxID=7175 RepID=A0A8D8G138_CULPI